MSAAARAAARESLRREAASDGDSALDGQVIRLDLSYRLPALCGDERNQARLAHEDLEVMDADELTTEATRLAFALAFGVFAQSPPWARAWLSARLRRCQALRKGGRA